MLIIGIIFVVFLVPGEQLQGFEYPAALWSVISADYLSSRDQSFGK